MRDEETILNEIRKIREDGNDRLEEIGGKAFIAETNEAAKDSIERSRKYREERKKALLLASDSKQ